jgi:lipoate-protein ligase B
MVATCQANGVHAERRDGHPGCWVDADGEHPRKIGALGVRVERGVTYHGIALNVNVALEDFDLIDPCGMPGLVSTSIALEAGRPDERPSTEAVEAAARAFARAFGTAIGASVLGPHATDAPDAPQRARAELERLLASAAAA